MPMFKVKNLMKMVWTIPYIGTNEKKLSLCPLHINLDVAELTFTGLRSRSCSKIKPIF